MKIQIKIETEVEAKFLSVKAGARYWEDTSVNGVEDVKGDLIPCRKGDYWCPIIEIDTGKITNWKDGVTAIVHYKVCDDGKYTIHDSEGDHLYVISTDYVPGIMCPKEEGFGDYIIMDIDENGMIKDWVANTDNLKPE